MMMMISQLRAAALRRAVGGCGLAVTQRTVSGISKRKNWPCNPGSKRKSRNTEVHLECRMAANNMTTVFLL